MVWWHDAAGLFEEKLEWLTLDQCKDSAKEKYGELCLSTGEILYETKDYIVIAATSVGERLYSDGSMIPKALIVKRKSIKIA